LTPAARSPLPAPRCLDPLPQVKVMDAQPVGVTLRDRGTGDFIFSFEIWCAAAPPFPGASAPPTYSAGGRAGGAAAAAAAAVHDPAAASQLRGDGATGPMGLPLQAHEPLLSQPTPARRHRRMLDRAAAAAGSVAEGAAAVEQDEESVRVGATALKPTALVAA
jgi:hypothetical protein